MGGKTMGLTRDANGSVVGLVAATDMPTGRELSRENLHLVLTPVMYTKAADSHSIEGREELSGVLFKVNDLTVHNKAHLVIAREGPWRALTIAIKSLYVASGTRQITFERKVIHGRRGAASLSNGRARLSMADGRSVVTTSMNSEGERILAQ